MALDPITAGMDLAGKVIDKLWPDKSEQERAQLAAAVAVVQGQIDINKVEAGSSSTFVAGWRPAVGWVCAAALAWQYIVRPGVTFGFATAGHAMPELPTIDGQLWELMFGMLGFGGLRTFEKVKGVAS